MWGGANSVLPLPSLPFVGSGAIDISRDSSIAVMNPDGFSSSLGPDITAALVEINLLTSVCSSPLQICPCPQDTNVLSHSLQFHTIHVLTLVEPVYLWPQGTR